MSAASKRSCCLALMLGGVLAFAAVVVAVPLAEKAPKPKLEKVSKNKPVRYIEALPEANPTAAEEIPEVEIPLLGPEKLPASEPLPLELKGVRG